MLPLHAVFVSRADQRALFDQALHVFWKNPRRVERMMSLVLPEFRDSEPESAEVLSRRLSEAFSQAAPANGSDSRRAFASGERFPDVQVLGEWPDEALKGLRPDHRTAIVTLTHDPKLADIRGDVGARHLIGEHAELVREVSMTEPGVLVDVDSPAALKALAGVSTRHGAED